MYPVGHLAVGYLAYSVVGRIVGWRLPADGAVLALAVGTQFPDLVDKPLAWWFGVLPAGRTLAHSVYGAVVVLAAVGLVASKFEREHLATAFGFGYVSHLLGDAIYAVGMLESADVAAVRFLAWPLTDTVVYVLDWNLLEYLDATVLTPTFGVELVVAAVALLLWLRDARGARADRRSRSPDDETVEDRAD